MSIRVNHEKTTEPPKRKNFAMKMYKANEKVPITVYREEANFDRACDEAYRQAISTFNVDESGYANNVVDNCRSTDSVMIEFKNFQHGASMTGHSIVYEFEAWIDRYNEDNEDDE